MYCNVGGNGWSFQSPLWMTASLDQHCQTMSASVVMPPWCFDLPPGEEAYFSTYGEGAIPCLRDVGVKTKFQSSLYFVKTAPQAHLAVPCQPQNVRPSFNIFMQHPQLLWALSCQIGPNSQGLFSFIHRNLFNIHQTIRLGHKQLFLYVQAPILQCSICMSVVMYHIHKVLGNIWHKLRHQWTWSKP